MSEMPPAGEGPPPPAVASDTARVRPRIVARLRGPPGRPVGTAGCAGTQQQGGAVSSAVAPWLPPAADQVPLRCPSPAGFGEGRHLSLRSINHISKVCSSVEASAAFYRDVLGFILVKRPQSFNDSFEGCW